MKWEEVAKHVSKAAPLLGTVLGGPAGGAIGAIVASAFGVENTPDAISEAVKKDPKAALKLKEIELKHKETLEQQAFNVLDVELKDKQSARDAHKHSRMPSVICIALTFLVGAGAYMLFTITIPTANDELAFLLFGTVLAKWGDSIAFWVGTTRSSAEKTRLMK